MKILSRLAVLSVSLLIASCGSGGGQKNIPAETDTTTVADTGYTGIKKMMSGQYIVMEVTFKNGVREGLTKTFYKDGKLQRTYWYVNGLRQDSSCWFYPEGQVFRVTPFVNDTVEGIQKQFYRTGQLKAKMGYSNGYRTLFFEEFTREGKLVTGYPDIKVTIQDNYKTSGLYRIILEPDKNADVRYFRGEMTAGSYDTTKVKRLPVRNGRGYLDLKKSTSAKTSSVGVFAEVLTDFGNRKLIYKKFDLPYNDLK